MCGEFWLVRQRVFWFSDLLPHAKTRDRETTEFKMVLEMFGTGWTSCNEVIRHDAVRTTIPHSHHRVGVAERGMLLPKRPVQSVDAFLLSHLAKSLHGIPLKPIEVGRMIQDRVELIVYRSEIGGRIA